MDEHPFIWVRESLEADLRLVLQSRHRDSLLRTRCHKLARNIIAAIRWLNVRILVECNPAEHPVGADLVKDLGVWYKGQRRI